jgi:hypothetical protein
MTEQSIYKLKIDTAFRQLIPPLSAEELLYLEESIMQDGCHDPLFVWNSTILDGHSRYEICTKLQIPFKIQRIYLRNREEAIAWICAHQLGHPNITEETRRYLIGKRCETEKLLGAHHAAGVCRYTKKELRAGILPEPAFAASGQTRERLSEQYRISSASILNYEKYTQALDLLSKIIPELVPRILSSQVKISLENTIALSQLSVPEIKELSPLLSDNSRGFILNLRQKLLKKQNSSERNSLLIPAGSIKEMPVYDPDAEISSLVLTIPSWISSINRTRSASDFNDVTSDACRRLEKELKNLKETINHMLETLKEVN